MNKTYNEQSLFHLKNGIVWKKVYEILLKSNGKPPSPDEMQDAWEDFLGQEFQD